MYKQKITRMVIEEHERNVADTVTGFLTSFIADMVSNQIAEITLDGEPYSITDIEMIQLFFARLGETYEDDCEEIEERF